MPRNRNRGSRNQKQETSQIHANMANSHTKQATKKKVPKNVARKEDQNYFYDLLISEQSPYENELNKYLDDKRVLEETRQKNYDNEIFENGIAVLKKLMDTDFIKKRIEYLGHLQYEATQFALGKNCQGLNELICPYELDEEMLRDKKLSETGQKTGKYIQYEKYLADCQRLNDIYSLDSKNIMYAYNKKITGDEVARKKIADEVAKIKTGYEVAQNRPAVTEFQDDWVSENEDIQVSVQKHVLKKNTPKENREVDLERAALSNQEESREQSWSVAGRKNGKSKINGSDQGSNQRYHNPTNLSSSNERGQNSNHWNERHQNKELNISRDHGQEKSMDKNKDKDFKAGSPIQISPRPVSSLFFYFGGRLVGDVSDNEIQKNEETVDWAEVEAERQRALFGHLPEVKKVTYHECEEVKNMTQEEVLALRKKKNDITIVTLDGNEANNVPNLISTFEQAFKKYPKIMKIIRAQGFKEPSPIQSQLWPLLLSGRDAVGVAQTGTGKTLAYLLPALIHIEKQPYFKDKNRTGPVCVILAPTRELAQQICAEVNKFKFDNLRSVCVYGRGDYEEQLEALQTGVEIVVATPGRLMDFEKKKLADVSGVSYLVLDEADRMLDMGFMSSVLHLINNMRPDRQTVMTTATWFCDVKYIVDRKMIDPVKVNVGELDLAAVDTITQSVYVCEEEDKETIMADIMKEIREDDKVIIFTNRKAVARNFSSICEKSGLTDYCTMHGDMYQEEREQSLRDLKSGARRVMVATDLASRGLDVLDLTLVINYDLPKNMEEYVHRSGRTGRAGKTGEVISLVTWENRNQAEELINILKRTNQEVPRDLQRLAERAKRFKENRRGRGRGRGGVRRLPIREQLYN